MVLDKKAVNKKRLYSTRQQLIVLNQINTILSSLINTEQVVSSLLYILLIHEFFSFSQIYVFSMSETEGLLRGEYCIGYKSQKDKQKALKHVSEEIEKLKAGMKQQGIQSDDTSTRIMYQELMDMSAYICHTRVEKNYHSLFSGKDLRRYSSDYYAKKSDVFTRVINSQSINVITDNESLQKEGLTDFLPPAPLLFIPLVARNQVFSVIVASKCFEKKTSFKREKIALLEWILKRLIFIFENCLRYEELDRAFQRLSEIDQMKTNFISMISHELQTPLINIIGYSHLLVNKNLGEINQQQEDALKKIVIKSEQLYDEIRQILLRVRLDSGDVWKEDRQTITLRSFFEDIIRQYDQKIFDKQVQFRLKIPRKKVTFFVRHQMLRNMICILIDNAIKFSKSPVQVDINVRVRTDRTFHVNVTDNGIGIPSGEIDSIFTPFYQVQGSLQREYLGMGIGLNTLHELVNQLGGKILVKSTLGKGSSFELILPADQVLYYDQKLMSGISTKKSRNV